MGQERQSSLFHAAVLLSVLGEKACFQILKQLPDSKVQALIDQMQRVEEVPIEQVVKILQTFHSQLTEEKSFLFPENGKDLLRLIEQKRRKNLFGAAAYQGQLEVLEMIDTPSLVRQLSLQHPQIVATVLGHLSPLRRVLLVKNLPHDLAVEAMIRMSRLGPIAAEELNRLNQALQSMHVLSTATPNSGKNKRGGKREVAAMLQKMDRGEAKKLLEKLKDSDPQLFQSLSQLSFTFSHLLQLTDPSIATLLRKVDRETLLLALKLAPPGLIEKITQNMSRSAAKNLLHDLEQSIPRKKSEVLDAQEQVLQLAKNLLKQNVIHLLDPEDVLV